LRQPYFHKSVTQGVLLNRASDLVLNDEDIVYEEEDDEQTDRKASNSWRIHFGGDIGSWYEEIPNFVCLHTVASDAALAVSDPIFVDNGEISFDNIFVTSHFGARTLIESGEATMDDLLTFGGVCGWEKGQLQKEVDRGSWYIASASGPGIMGEEAVSPPRRLWQMMETWSWKNSQYNPQSAGIQFWETVMTVLGKEHELGTTNSFSDLMLKEWATERLLVAKTENNGMDGAGAVELDDSDIFRALRAASDYGASIQPGRLFRGSSSHKRPYLLKNQLFHKSTILFLQEEKEMSVGVLLNIPTTDSYSLLIHGDYVDIPIRYGGPSGKVDEQPLLFFHNVQILKEKGIGRPIGETNSEVYVCTASQVVEALEDDLVSPNDVIAVQGFCAWEKEMGSGGILGELASGNLEAVPSTSADAVFETLRTQRAMSEENLDTNLRVSQEAWELGKGNGHCSDKSHDRCVFDSDVRLSDLSDDALKVWIEIFILGNGEYSDYVA
jgi:putative AlgH/UPF0301 family transcriptional regulator